jgi:hypothetical protein
MMNVLAFALLKLDVSGSFDRLKIDCSQLASSNRLSQPTQQFHSIFSGMDEPRV